jgi:hypothetical protein
MPLLLAFLGFPRRQGLVVHLVTAIRGGPRPGPELRSTLGFDDRKVLGGLCCVNGLDVLLKVSTSTEARHTRRHYASEGFLTRMDAFVSDQVALLTELSSTVSGTTEEGFFSRVGPAMSY